MDILKNVNVLDYEPLIRATLSREQVKSRMREDLKQECFVALLENQDRLSGPDNVEQATKICELVIRKLKSLSQDRFGCGNNSANVPQTLSMSIPGVHDIALKIPMVEEEITEEKLQQAIVSLPWDQYQVIYSLFVEGKTQEKTAADLGLSRKNVRTLSDRGVKNLKKWFGV